MSKRTTYFLCLVASGLLLCLTAAAQKSTPVLPRPSSPTPSTMQNTTPNVAHSPFELETNESDARMENLRARSRAEDRRKRMVEDANRLVALTARYRAAVEDHGKETPEDARLLLDIEKLARSVKDRMRGM